MSKSSSRDVIVLSLSIYSENGGIQRYTKRLIRSLNEIRQDNGVGNVIVISLRDASIKDEFGSDVRGCNGNPAQFAATVIRVLTGANSPILIANHVFLAPFVLVAKTLRPRVLKPFVIAHGHEVWRVTKRSSQLALKYSRATVVCVSDLTRRRMKATWQIPNQYELLPCAIDVGTPKQSSNHSALNVLCVSRLNKGDRTKHVRELIDAVNSLKSELPIRLTVVGGGNDLDFLREHVDSLRCNEHVSLVGNVSDEAVWNLYEQSSIFALPSTQEGFGIVYLEAWINGLAVIGGNDGAAPEVIEHGKDGLIASPNPDEIAKALRQLATDPETIQRMASQGQDKVRRLYSHEAFKKNLRILLNV